MAESTDDKQVDSAIVRMQALLDELKSAQEKDVKDEGGEEEPFGGKNLKEAEQEAYVRVRAHQRRRRQADESSSEK